MPKNYEFIKVIKTLMTEEHLQKISMHSLASIYHWVMQSLSAGSLNNVFQQKA